MKEINQENRLPDEKELRQENLSRVKKADRKALPKFLLILLIAAVVGFAAGDLMAMIEEAGISALGETLKQFWRASAVWYFPVFTLLLLLPAFLLTVGVRKKIDALPEDDEVGVNAGVKALDRRLSVSLSLGSFYVVGIYFSLAVGLSNLAGLHFQEGWIIPLIEGVAGIVLLLPVQRRAVTLTQYLYPEKKWSIFDTKFSKVWMESCDEREKMIVYKAAYASYQATGKACVLLFLLIALGSTVFGYGPLPSALILMIWLIQIISYTRACAREEKK